MARTETTGIAVHFSHARHFPSGSIHNPDLYTLLAPRNLFHSSSPYRRSDVEERGRCLLMSHRIYCSYRSSTVVEAIRSDASPVRGAALNGRVRGVAGNILASMTRLTKMKIYNVPVCTSRLQRDCTWRMLSCLFLSSPSPSPSLGAKSHLVHDTDMHPHAPDLPWAPARF